MITELFGQNGSQSLRDELAIVKFTFDYGPIWQYSLSLPVKLAILEFTFLDFLIRANDLAISIQQIVKEVTLLSFTILQDLRALPGKFSFFEGTAQNLVAGDGQAIAIGLVVHLVEFSNVELFGLL